MDNIALTINNTKWEVWNIRMILYKRASMTTIKTYELPCECNLYYRVYMDYFHNSMFLEQSFKRTILRSIRH